MISTGRLCSTASGKLSKYKLKCGFNQRSLDTQVFEFLQEVCNETGLFSFHLAKKQEQEKKSVGLCPGWRASHCLRATLGTRLDGAAQRSWGASLPSQGMLSVANTHTFISSEEVRAVPATHGLLAGMQPGGSSSPELRLYRCKMVRRRYSSPLTSPHPKYAACWASFLHFCIIPCYKWSVRVYFC